MILKRFAANLRAQDWTAVLVEIGIVLIGVFLGIAAANWNEERLERRETDGLLRQLAVELRAVDAALASLDQWYATTGKFAAIANAGWEGDPAINDDAFVIAAYQASQVNAVGNNSAVWAQIFGADDLRNIEDRNIRDNLARIMTFDYTLVSLASVSTPYRQQVRKVIPSHIQSAIRRFCGDRPRPDGLTFDLPETCTIDIPDEDSAAAAASLRSTPGLQAELRWHQAAVANQLLNVAALRRLSGDLIAQLDLL
jgi:hypothetical protein